MKRRTSRAGMTVTEFIVAAGILLAIMAMATVGYLQLVRGERRSAQVAQLDMDVRKAVEVLREGLRLTTIDQVIFYPPNVSPARAISFPAALDLDDDGLVDLAAGGTNVLWSQTVVYHVLPSSPHQLLRTTFQPRNNALTEAQRAEQLRRVVEQDDHGADYELEPYRQTTRIFSNFFEWRLSSKSTAFDGYSPIEERVAIPFGSCVLEPGEHRITFRISDKNTENTTTSYRLALDTLRTTLSGGETEAEEMPVAAASPAAATVTTIPEVCSANNYLNFPATALNQEISLLFRNDEWVESNFRSSGVRYSNTVSTAIGTRLDNSVVLDGVGEAWTVISRTDNAIGYWENLPSYGTNGVLVRIPLEGVASAGTNSNVGTLVRSGALRRVPSADTMADSARLLSTRCLEMAVYYGTEPASSYAVIAESDENGQPVAGTEGLIFLSRRHSGNVTGSGYLVHGWYVGNALYPISAAKRYVLSFWLKPTVATPWVANWAHPSYALLPATQIRSLTPADLPAAQSLLGAAWPSGSYYSHTKVVALQRLITSFAPAGEFVSQVYDTGFDNPVFENITWSNTVINATYQSAAPLSGTSLALALRSGSDPNLDGVAWTSVSKDAAPAVDAAGRYVQFRVRATSDSLSSQSPALHQLRLQWDAPLGVVNLSGTLYKGPDRGAFEILVDGKKLVRSVRVELTLFRDVTTINYKTERLTSSMVAEVEPRNTGR